MPLGFEHSGGDYGGPAPEPRSLSTGLAKLRRATELALAYPDVTINRLEADAILTHIEGAMEAAERAAEIAERVTRALESIPEDRLTIGDRVQIVDALTDGGKIEMPAMG